MATPNPFKFIRLILLLFSKFRLGFSNADHTLNDLILTINPKDVDLR